MSRTKRDSAAEQTSHNKGVSITTKKQISPRDDRKAKRLTLLKWIMSISGVLYFLYFVALILDEYCFKEGASLGKTPAMIAFGIFIGSIFTTCLGAIIGSSID